MDQVSSTPFPASDWDRLSLVLDEAMSELNAADYEALVMRFFKNHTMKEVGLALGLSEGSAQKRVSRALAKLQNQLFRRGITSSAALSLLITANAVQAAPPGLSLKITAAVAAKNLIPTASTAKGIAMTSFQKSVLSAIAIIFLSTSIYQGYRASHAMPPRGRSMRIEKTENNTLVASTPRLALPTEKPHSSTMNRERLAQALFALRDALHPPSLGRGVRVYPPDEVIVAMRNLGLARKEAFATIFEALQDPDLEVRSRAISALGLAGRAASPENGLLGEPAPEAKGVLWKMMKENEELGGFALSALRTIGFTAEEIPALANTLVETTNPALKRYVPEALSKIIEEDPEAAASHIPRIETLLCNEDTGVQFEAACALAKLKAASPEILNKLMAGLGSSGLHQLMALETFQTLGSSAASCVQAISNFANLTTEDNLREIAYQTLGKINGSLRTASPEIDQSLKNQETTAYWNDKFSNGNYSYEELLVALKEPAFAAVAAKHLTEWGASAKSAVPQLISALSGQDQNKRDEIVEAIRQIDPQASVEKVSSKPIITAAQRTVLYLESKAEDHGQLVLTKLLDRILTGNSDWYTRQEVRELAKQVALGDDNAYRTFVGQVLEMEPSLSSLFRETTGQ